MTFPYSVAIFVIKWEWTDVAMHPKAIIFEDGDAFPSPRSVQIKISLLYCVLHVIRRKLVKYGI
jgi:hypothetical protein